MPNTTVNENQLPQKRKRGRPLGSKDKRKRRTVPPGFNLPLDVQAELNSQIFRDEVSNHIPAIASKLIDLAKEGNNNAATLVLKYAFVPPSPQTTIDLPDLADLPPIQRLDEIARRAARGLIPLEIAKQMAELAEKSVRFGDIAMFTAWSAAVAAGQDPLAAAAQLSNDPQLLAAAKRKGVVVDQALTEAESEYIEEIDLTALGFGPNDNRE